MHLAMVWIVIVYSESRASLIRTQFKTLLSATQALKYNTHSFQIGAATSAKALGISDVYIKLLGWWRNSAYQGYIKTPTHVLTKLSKQPLNPHQNNILTSIISKANN